MGRDPCSWYMQNARENVRDTRSSMAVSAFRSATRGEGGHRKTSSSFSDSSSRYLSDAASVIDSSHYQDASSQRDSDQDSFCPDPFNRSDSESEASSIIDRFRHTGTRNPSTANVPRFQQSTASARGRQKTIEPHQRRSLSREPASRGRSESEEPGLRRYDRSEPPRGRSESQEPGYRRQGRSQSKEPAPRHRRSLSREPGFNRLSLSSTNDDDSVVAPQRGRSVQRSEIVFTSGRQSQDMSSVRSRRSESQEPRGRSQSKEPARRRSESQGPGPLRYGALLKQQLDEHPASDVQAEERTITAVHAQLKATDPPAGDFDGVNLYGAMRAEVRKAVADLKTEIEKSLEKDMLTLVKGNGEVSEPEIRRQCAEQLEQSEIRTKELLAQLAKEEETRLELAKLAKGLPPSKPEQKPITRSDEKKKNICQALDEEAQKYFEEFASISTSETEEPARRRSKTSPSRHAVRKKSPAKAQAAAPARSSEGAAPPPRWKTGFAAVNADGVVTPWLDWETDSADDTLAEINWDSIVALSNVPADDGIRESEEGFMQRLRFRQGIEGGRIHLCKGEF